MNPAALLRSRSGRLYEVYLLAAFLGTGVAFSTGYGSLLKGFLASALLWGGLLAGLLALTVLAEKVDRLGELLDSRAFRMVKTAASVLAAGAALAAVAGFASMFIAPLFAATPEGQLRIMRGLTAAGALLGASWVVKASRT